MPDTALPYRGSMFISFDKFGWSETFNFGTIEESDALARLNCLAFLRARMLPPTCEVNYARVTVQGDPGKSLVSLTAPLVGSNDEIDTPPSPEINDVSVGLMFRVQAAGAVHASRHLHAIPDQYIVNNGFTLTTPVGGWTPLNTMTPSDPPEGATWLEALTNYLSAIKILTTLNSRVVALDGDGNQVVSYSPRIISGMVLRGVRRRKVGRPFDYVPGRVIRR